MGSRRTNVLVVLFVSLLLAGSLAAIFTKDTKLGLDLRGGTQLVFEAQGTPQNPDPQPDDIQRAIEIVRDRVDSLGVAEPEISQLGATSIQVNLPDVQDIQRAQEQVGTTAQLYFYDLEPNIIPLQSGVEPPIDPNEIAANSTARIYDAVKLASKQKPECFQDACTTTGARYYAFNEETKELVGGPDDTRSDLTGLPDVLALPDDQVEIVEVPQGTIVVEDQNQTSSDGSGDELSAERYLVLRDRPSLSGEDIRNPEQNFDPQTNQPNVTFDFTDKGRQQFQEVTAEIATRGLATLGQTPNSFAIVLDDSIVSRPVIDPAENPSGIDGRTGAQISGGFGIQEAQDLANSLRIGALPVSLTLVSQSTISATLGQQALDQATLAGLIGLALVVLFLLFYYRFLGLVATLGLVVYAIFFFAMMKLIPITLTLPGIAGLILTIGVAADSNIVIFERIKEEAGRGHSMLSAITTGYRKGIGTIIDANVITLLTAFVLFGLATGGVKGFAFTLGIGVLVSLFTAVVFTRAVLGLLGRSRLLTDPKFVGAGDGTKRWGIDFAGLSKWFFSASGAILAIGAISFATAQLNFGIDFESGTRIKASLVESASIEEVRSSLSAAGVEEADSAKIQAVSEPEFGDNVVQIQADVQPDQVGLVQDQLDDDFGLALGAEDETEGGFDSDTVGPTFGEQIARSAVYAIIFSLILISAYVAFRFEAKYAVPVLIAVVHDLLITAGIYSLAGREVSSATVAALLTILGYSLYDCVIVFDRIRENVPRLPRATFAQIANRSLNEVLTRSLITGLSTVFLVTVIMIFGGETLTDFAFAMAVGLISGTYSSLFIAAPVLIAWKEREPGYRARAARIRELMGKVPPFPEMNEVARVGDGPDDAPELPSGGDGNGKGRYDDGVSDDAMPVGTDFSGAQPAADPESGSGREAVPTPDVDEGLTPEEVAERERKREVRRQRKERRERQRKHGRPR